VRWFEGEGGGGGGAGVAGGSNASSSDSGLHRLRDGLALAAGRTDELALRRVWARVADAPMPRPRHERSLLISGFFLLAVGIGAIGFALSLRISEVSPPIASRATSAPVAVAPTVHEEPVPVLLGPATLQTGSAESKRVRLKGGALISVSAQTTLTVDAGQRPAVSRGHIELEVPRQPPGEQFTVEAGPYMIVVVGTKFDVGMGARQAEVSVKEGVVEVWRDGRMVRLKAGNFWRGPLGQPSQPSVKVHRPVRSASRAANRRGSGAMAATRDSGPSFVQHPSDRFDQAKLALATGDAAAGLEILRDLATGSGPIAENSGYEIGLVLRDRHHEPRLAIEAWKQYRERFPRGLLRAEADLSIVETELEIGQRDAAMAEAEAFLRRYPRSERRAEVEGLLRRLSLADAGGDHRGPDRVGTGPNVELAAEAARELSAAPAEEAATGAPSARAP
jgi:hypothetical protein